MAEIPKQLWVDHPPVVCHATFGKTNVVPKSLHYFAVQVLGELPRLCLEYTETPHRSIIYFASSAYKQFSPLGQLPCYQGVELGEGVYLGQSSAICRHIARETGIFGSSPADCALQDMLWETGKDLIELKSALHSDEVSPKLDGMLKGLIKLQSEGKCLGTGDRRFEGASKLGFGEISIFHALYSFELINAEFLSAYPKLREFVNAVLAAPSIANYLKSPRRLPMTQNEVGKGHQGVSGYVYVTDMNPETLATEYKGEDD